MKCRSAFVMMVLLATVGTAGAQPTPTPQEAEPVPAPYVAPPSPLPASDPNQSIAQAMGQTPSPPAEEEKQPKEPKRGDFDAGGQLRFPSGPDEMGTFETFNWVALDVKGKYYLLKSVTLNGHIPLAIIKPDDLGPVDPRMLGGMLLRLDATLPRSSLGITLTTAYMREGAMLLSEKDYPLFAGDFQPGISGGILAKLRLGSLLDLSLVPAFVFQKGTAENYTAIQIPMALIVKLADFLKVSADLGIFTGDDLSLRAKNDGRIYLGAALDVKIGPIALHAGAGVASLFTDAGGVYPTMKDSIYVDINAKYVK